MFESIAVQQAITNVNKSECTERLLDGKSSRCDYYTGLSKKSKRDTLPPIAGPAGRGVLPFIPSFPNEQRALFQASRGEHKGIIHR